MRVAVGVLQNAKQEVLVALRPAHSHQGGLWEFPGGKVEDGESVEQALRREFEEELSISVQDCHPLIQIRHAYSDKSVLLDVWRIESFSGIPQGREGQRIEWRALSRLKAADFPKANERIIRALSLPERIAITPDARDFDELREIINHQLSLKARLLYLRQQSVDEATYQEWFAWAAKQCAASGARLMYSPVARMVDRARFTAMGALHLSAEQLLTIDRRPVSPQQLFSASCRTRNELRKAEAVDADFVILPLSTEAGENKGPSSAAWKEFRSMADSVNVPVFAEGELRPEHRGISKIHGGFGIAGIAVF